MSLLEFSLAIFSIIALNNLLPQLFEIWANARKAPDFTPDDFAHIPWPRRQGFAKQAADAANKKLKGQNICTKDGEG